MKIKYVRTKFHDLEDLKKPQANDKQRSVSSNINKISYLLYFFLIVSLVIIIALFARVVFLYQKSTFNSSSYSIFVNSKTPFLIAFDKQLGQLSIIRVPSVSRDRIDESVSLGVPIDGQIENESLKSDNFLSFSSILDQIFKPWGYHYQNMTVLDSIRLFYYTYSIPKKDILRATIKLSKDGEVSGVSQDQLYNIFKDARIVNEQESIEIVNATQIAGLAGLVGRVIKNAGGNVVSITSGDGQLDTVIQSSSSSETLTRLAGLLGTEPTINENIKSTADIQIILGSDFGNKVLKNVK